MNATTLQSIFETLKFFRLYCEDGFHIRHGYDIPDDMWNANPTILFF